MGEICRITETIYCKDKENRESCVQPSTNALFCLLQKNRKKHRLFLVFKGLESSRVRNCRQQRFKSTTICFTNHRLRGADPRMSMKKTNNNKQQNQASFQSNGSVGEGWRGACRQWGETCVCVRLCTCRWYAENSLFGLGGITCRLMKRQLPFCKRTQVQTVIPDGTRARPQALTTQWHENQTEHVWPKLQHSPYTFFFFFFFLNPLLSGCKDFSSFLNLKLTRKLFFCI